MTALRLRHLDGVALLVALWIEPDGPAACDGTMGVPATVGVPMRLSPSKAELYAAIRRDHEAGMSGRKLQRKYQVT